MTIEERMDRRAVEDQIYIGELVERHISGEFGILLKCLAEEIKEKKIAESDEDPDISPDRVLGIIVGLTGLQSQLGYCVSEANRFKEEAKEETELKTDIK